MTHTAHKQRVSQTMPRPDELLSRFEEVMELWDDLLVPFVVGNAETPCFKNRDRFDKLRDKFVEEIKRDRFSDPPDVSMHVERKNGTLNSLRGTNKLEGWHKYLRELMSSVTRIGLQEFCHRLMRFIFKWNLTMGERNMDWSKVRHYDVEVIVLAHEADPSKYPIVHHLQNHVDTGMSIMADHHFDSIGDDTSDPTPGEADAETQTVEPGADGEASTLGAADQPTALLSGSGSDAGADCDSSGHLVSAGIGDDGGEEGELSAAGAAAAVERRVHDITKRNVKSGKQCELMAVKEAIRACVSTPIDTAPEVSLALFVLSEPGCGSNPGRAAAVYNGCVRAFHRAEKPCVLRMKDAHSISRFQRAVQKQLAGTSKHACCCDARRAMKVTSFMFASCITSCRSPTTPV